MKDQLGNDYFLIAHIDVEKVKFKKDLRLSPDYIHVIDDWDELVFSFRHKRIKKKSAKRARRSGLEHHPK